MPITNPILSVEGLVVIVTGGSSGLGAHLGRTLSESGATVVLAARRTHQLSHVAAELENTVAIACDVTDDEQCRTLVEETVSRFGRIDVLVSNAGISAPARVEDESIDDFRRVVDVNLLGTYSINRHAGMQMAQGGGGSIINIASVLGLVGIGRMPQASYTASKAGVINLTRELAAQWARRGVRVNAIAPGFFPSEMTAELFATDEEDTWVARMTPMGRGGRLDEMDGAVLYLASAASSYVTGTVLPVDGGWTAV